MEFGLRGKKALVTGASSGIGAGIARALAAEGVEVAICSRTRDKLELKAAELARLTGGKVIPIPADLSTLEGCRHFVREAHERLGGIDILVNNAGASTWGAFIDLSDEEFVHTVNSKLLGYVRCSREVIRHMSNTAGGVIVNITGATQQGVAMHSAGGSCNAAIRMFSKILSLELAPQRIRVNSIGPGRINTERTEQTFAAAAAGSGSTPEAETAKLLQTIPSGRLGNPDDIANVVCFLASDLSGYVNGAALSVDGGKSVVI